MTSPRDESLTVTNSFSSPSHQAHRILVVFGTRPEAIKLCPLIARLRELAPDFETVVCVTGQHREMLDQVLELFGIQPDYDLDVMTKGQTLTALTSRILAQLEPVFEGVQPALTVVQGDTTTTLCGALTAFYRGVPVAHVEAGLPTHNLESPFPEEMNRVVVSRLAALHFAPTQRAADNLGKEHVPSEYIEITGNTGIDAVLHIARGLQAGKLRGFEQSLDDSKKLIVVTAHRRENFGESLRHICEAVREIAQRPDTLVVWPVHRNPDARGPVETALAGQPNVLLTQPLSYVPFVDLLRRSTLILTDSGGIQEEAPSLGKPVLVLRDSTERREAVEAGTARLVGSHRAAIVRECARLLDNASEREQMTRIHNPYGDGKASERISNRIARFVKTPAT